MAGDAWRDGFKGEEASSVLLLLSMTAIGTAIFEDDVAEPQMRHPRRISSESIVKPKAWRRSRNVSVHAGHQRPRIPLNRFLHDLIIPSTAEVSCGSGDNVQ